jgi:hypothetical protein
MTKFLHKRLRAQRQHLAARRVSAYVPARSCEMRRAVALDQSVSIRGPSRLTLANKFDFLWSFNLKHSIASCAPRLSVRCRDYGQALSILRDVVRPNNCRSYSVPRLSLGETSLASKTIPPEPIFGPLATLTWGLIVAWMW